VQFSSSVDSETLFGSIDCLRIARKLKGKLSARALLQCDDESFDPILPIVHGCPVSFARSTEPEADLA
jgi:hypothetical protein